MLRRKRSQITIFSPSFRINPPSIMADVSDVQPEAAAGTAPDPNVQPESVQTEEEKLKYLEFLQGAAQQAFLYASQAYGYAKDNAGPLKTSVESLEGTVKNTVGPVYNKYNGVPVDLLKYVDRKVDESVKNLDSSVPPTVKDMSSRALSFAQSAPETARSVTPVAGEYASTAWKTLNQLPLVSRAAKAAGPTASYLSEKYNQTVQQSAVSSYLPLVPTDKIAKALKVDEEAAAEQPAAAPAAAAE